MGTHACEYCHGVSKGNQFSHLSSEDVILYFENGNSWMMPAMILHYIADHQWKPPQEFVDDVMNSKLTDTARRWTLDISETSEPQKVGYLSGPFEEGSVPDGFVGKLQALMQQAGP